MSAREILSALGRALLLPPATVWVGRTKFEFPDDGPEVPEASGEAERNASPIGGLPPFTGKD